MGGRLYGFQFSGISHTETIDIGAEYVYRSGTAVPGNRIVGPGATMVCLFVQSGSVNSKWIPLTERMLRNT